jgi:YesN/AraC family two-component response regulator
MNRHSERSLHFPGPAAIPELDGFDTTAFDTLPIWASVASDPPPAILIVDDEPDVGQILYRIVQNLVPHYDILISTDPVEALERIRGRTVPLVITDVAMPVMNGVDLATQIKRSTPETHILLITAYPNQALARQALHRGIEYLLPKPFNFRDLERIVRITMQSDETTGQSPHQCP